MVYFQNPENALKRAKEFIEVNKKNDALDTLHEVLRMRRHRQYQHDLHEPIITLYLSLCVELKKGHAAKEGLYQYKILTQNTDINSLEKVIRRFVQTAENRAEEASKEAKSSKGDMADVEDLDMLYTPESLMLSTVSGEDDQDRADRTVLTPWVKFLWEVYRHVLDILKNNNKVEKLYQDMAQLAFTFCIKYERKTEFRKLSDSVRNHLNLIIKHSHQANSINLNDPVSLQLHLDTRLYQLDCAIKISLWQEAIKTINDIHSLMQLSKKKPKPQALANYYKKQALVFSKANNRLFEACALMKHYQLVFDQKKTATVEEKQMLASGVLMATLAIPLPASMSENEKYLDLQNSTKDKNMTLASYLDLQHAPTRETLIADIVKQGIPGKVYPELQPLFKILEVDFQPLKLCSLVDTMLKEVEKTYPDLTSYAEDVREVAVLRLMRQLAQVYDKISISKVVSLIPYIEPLELELLIIEPAKTLDLQLRIDHSTQTFIFGSTIQYQREETTSGPTVQQMPSEMFRNQLVLLYNALNKSVDLISPAMKVQAKEGLRHESISAYMKSAKRDQQNMIKRKEMIENRKEYYENLNTEKERAELQEREKTRREAEKAETKRRDEEEKRRTEERSAREEKHKDKLLKMEKVKKLMEQLGEKPFEGLTEDELLEMEEEELLARGIEYMSKEKDDLKHKMKQVEKRLDYYTRAQRLVEIPLLKEEWEKSQEDDKIWWEEKEAARIEMAIKKREYDISTRKRLLRMKDDKDAFVASILSQKEMQHQEEVNRFEKELMRVREERKEAKKQEILKQLTEKRRKEQLAKEAEEKRKEKEEEIRRFKEEKMRSDAEAREAQLKQDARLRAVEERRAQQDKPERGNRGDRDGDRAWGGGDRWDRGGDRDRDRGGDRDRDRGGDRDRDRDGDRDRDRDEGPWRRSGSRNESPMRRDDRGDRRDDRGRRDEFRRDDMGRGGDRGDEPAPQRKRLQLQPRTKPADAPQRRSEPVGGAHRDGMGPRSTPDGRDGQRSTASARARGDGEEQDGFITVTKQSKGAYRPPHRR
ncbi:hypothetical protein ACHWQZ_G007113 [Mnemiopsis leidyi]